jgi:uncharacterized protein (TIGR03435 family)
MNAIQFLSAQPWVERLGLTLLHFLWQGVAIAAIYAAARRWSARSSADARYILACAALMAMAAAPVVTWSLIPSAPADQTAVPFTASISAAASRAVRNVPASLSAATYGVAGTPLLPWVVAVWIGGTILFWLRLIRGWIFAERLRYRLVRPAPREWQEVLDRLKARIRFLRPVRLLVSPLVQAPAVVGWLRPVVLAPVGALAGLAPEQVEALLLHELAHIRRHDYLVNIAQSAIEALLFYHPAVWWVSSEIRAERELCCDDMAVSAGGDAVVFARALARLELESASPSHLNPAVAATGGSPAHRIARLLGHSGREVGSISGPGIIGVTMLLAITAFALYAQPTARPKFEVASIKLIKPSPEQRQMVRPLPGRLVANATLRLLMQNAYTMQPFQIVGGPEWINSERYEIEAKTDGSADRTQIFLMLQSLLEDRFHLKIHREMKELPVYTLVAARGGLRLPDPKEGSCVSPQPDAAPGWVGGRIAPPGQNPPAAPPCGSLRLALGPGGPQVQGGKVAMPEFIKMLSLALERIVIDRTGFTGLFDVQLDFLADETTPSLPPFPPGAEPEFKNPSILVALQEQLGLRLEATKGPVEVIVIDQVERPSVN